MVGFFAFQSFSLRVSMCLALLIMRYQVGDYLLEKVYLVVAWGKEAAVNANEEILN